MTVRVLQTERLVLRRLDENDAAFIHEMLNDPSWIRFIGDRGVRTLDDARAYILAGPVAMYAQHGFGLWAVELRDDGVVIGMCGLVRRESLPDPDIGFALLPRFTGQGYALEAAQATLTHGRHVLGLERIVAVVSPDNARSAALLEGLGMRFERMVRLTDDGDELRLLAFEGLPGPTSA